MGETDAELTRARASMMRPAALVSALSVLVAWMLVLVEPSDYDGASGLLMLFGVPALCVAVLCIVVATRTGMSEAFGSDRRWLWWPLCVMPVSVLAALAVSVLRSPDYFIGEDSPCSRWCCSSAAPRGASGGAGGAV